jgi:CubicO group peptidase (beta-lactamase class C family)
MSTPGSSVHGFTAPGFDGVRDVLAQSLASGSDLGASFVAMRGADVLVDIWGGHTDEAKTTEWQKDTIINVWSTTKTMTFLCALMLADRGELDLDGPVAAYWPEFAANGKDQILFRHIMSHSSGLSGWAEPMQAADLEDWDKTCGILARQAPWWEPGTQSGYHAITQGYLIGEVVRRITGQSIGQFFKHEVADRLNADFHIGTPAECDDRVALVIPPTEPLSTEGVAPDSIAIRTLMNPQMRGENCQTIPWRRAEIPAAGGHGNARSVALVQSIIAGNGTRNGIEFLSEKTVSRIFEEQTNGMDLVLMTPTRFGMGYGLSNEITPLPETTCFWGGWGGSLCLVDPTNDTTLVYVMNKMFQGTVGDLRGGGLAMTALMSMAQAG